MRTSPRSAVRRISTARIISISGAAAFVVPAIGPQATYGIGGITAGLAVVVLLHLRRLLLSEHRDGSVVGLERVEVVPIVPSDLG